MSATIATLLIAFAFLLGCWIFAEFSSPTWKRLVLGLCTVCTLAIVLSQCLYRYVETLAHLHYEREHFNAVLAEIERLIEDGAVDEAQVALKAYTLDESAPLERIAELRQALMVRQ